MASLPINILRAQTVDRFGSVKGYDEPLDERHFVEVGSLADDDARRAIASGVGRLEILIDGRTEWGVHRCTASLISERYVLTAYHCLTSPYPPYAPLPLAAARVRFGYLSEAEPGSVWPVDPRPVAENFSPVEDLDYAVLEVLPDPQRGLPSASVRPVPLAMRDPAPGSPLYIIHYPAGANQRLTMADCAVTVRARHEPPIADTLTHRCDTRLGSSGAPVFDARSGAAVAVHHVGINRWHTNFAKRLTAIAADSEIIARLGRARLDAGNAVAGR